MEEIKQFLVGYWDHCQWWLVGIGVVYLILLIPFRQSRKAMTVLLLGIYLTMTAYFLSVREEMGLDPDLSLGVVIGVGLALGALLYYFFVIRAE